MSVHLLASLALLASSVSMKREAKLEGQNQSNTNHCFLMRNVPLVSRKVDKFDI